MKVIKYKTVTYISRGTEDTPILEEFLMDTVRTYSEMDVEVAAEEAYNGEYTIEDDGKPEPAPSQLDRIEAQAAYTAMMTDTLLEG